MKDNTKEFLGRKKAEEDDKAKREAERLRDEYLRRTGRTEMKP